MFNSNVIKRLLTFSLGFRSVAVITSASHAEGPQFDPGRKQVYRFDCN